MDSSFWFTLNFQVIAMAEMLLDRNVRGRNRSKPWLVSTQSQRISTWMSGFSVKFSALGCLDIDYGLVTAVSAEC